MLNGWRTTSAPPARATSAVASREPSSTTTTLKPLPRAASSARTAGRWAASLYAGSSRKTPRSSRTRSRQPDGEQAMLWHGAIVEAQNAAVDRPRHGESFWRTRARAGFMAALYFLDASIHVARRPSSRR